MSYSGKHLINGERCSVSNGKFKVFSPIKNQYISTEFSEAGEEEARAAYEGFEIYRSVSG